MTSRSFFSLSLLLPAPGAVLGSRIPKLEFLVVFFLGGLIPYAPIAISEPSHE